MIGDQRKRAVGPQAGKREKRMSSGDEEEGGAGGWERGKEGDSAQPRLLRP